MRGVRGEVVDGVIEGETEGVMDGVTAGEGDGDWPISCWSVGELPFGDDAFFSSSSYPVVSSTLNPLNPSNPKSMLAGGAGGGVMGEDVEASAVDEKDGEVGLGEVGESERFWRMTL